MAGTREGGLQAAETNKKRYGSDFYKKMGKLGGKKSKGGGFSYDNRSLWDKLKRKPKHAAIAGSKGGHKSRRGKAKWI